MQKITLESGYYYHKLAARADYLYVIIQQRQVIIECDGARRVETLQCTGILSIDKNCQILENFDTLYPAMDNNMKLIGSLKHNNWTGTIMDKAKIFALVSGCTFVPLIDQLCFHYGFVLRSQLFFKTT